MSLPSSASPAFELKKILVLEPYYGGSHKAFLEDLVRFLPFSFDFLTLPARKWKWRMRLAAPFFAEKMETMEKYDIILCSGFVDVACLRGLAPAWVRSVPVYTYFHENQFAYPAQQDDERDFHFFLTNFTSALASDQVAFNSEYNRESFLNGAKDLLKRSSDMELERSEEMIREKSVILHPGIDFTAIDQAPVSEAGDEPVILWNHRWEHDKNPEFFFKNLFELDRNGVCFKLVVLGKSFQRQPEIFQEAERRLQKRILHFGYLSSRKEYVSWLKKCDIIVSTAIHEFYGISVIEAVRAGCRPLLPRRLSYPELFPEEYLYADIDFSDRLMSMLRQKRLSRTTALRLTDCFSWTLLAGEYRNWFEI